MKRLPISVILALMVVALALFQLGGALLLALAGLLFFGLLALLRPDLGLLFVPLTVPLYLIPAAIQGLRGDGDNPFRLPLYEVVLLVVFGATLARWLWRQLTADDRRPTTDDRRPENQEPRTIDNGQQTTKNGQEPLIPYFLSLVPRLPFPLFRYVPHLLFLFAGALGVLLAVERSRALREFRWLIAEPLIFYALLTFQLARAESQMPAANGEGYAGSSPDRSPFIAWILAAFALSGAMAGLLGLLQFVGLDLVPLLGRKQCFAPDGGPCANIVADGGVRRVLSVYGHPNNLGLYLGRAWPLAATLAFAYARDKQPTGGQRGSYRQALFFALCAFCSLGGIVVSFSRGAWLGAAAALAVLVFGASAMLSRSPQRLSVVGRRSSIVGVGVVVLAIIGGLALTLRGDITAGSTPVRLLLWAEAAGYLQRHPLGIGLDQFGYYHDPKNAGLSLIDPALIGTSEQFAAHPHTMLLDTWLRVGPLGLLAFGWLLARFFRAGLPMARAPSGWPLALGELAAMVAALVHGQVDNFYFVPDLAITFWLLLALMEIDEAITRRQGLRLNR